MAEYIERNACDISRMIEDTYGKEFNIPYCIMEGDRYLKVIGICVMEGEDQIEVEKQIHSWQNTNGCGDQEDLEAIMSDLCAKGKLEAGDYLLEFDD